MKLFEMKFERVSSSEFMKEGTGMRIFMFFYNDTNFESYWNKLDIGQCLYLKAPILSAVFIGRICFCEWHLIRKKRIHD